MKILWTSAEEGSSIDAKTAQDKFKKVTLLIAKASTNKEKIKLSTELRKAKARIQAIS